jgi:hypothetical protein
MQPPRSDVRDLASSLSPGKILIGAGTILILLAFTVLDWFQANFFGNSGDSTFRAVHDAIDATKREAATAGISSHVSYGASDLYFSWLGWVLLVCAVAAGSLAVSAFGASIWGLRWLAAVVAMTGIALTFLALNLVTFEGNAPNNANAPTYGSYLSHSSLGAWSAVAGFLAILVGCFLPNTRR